MSVLPEKLEVNGRFYRVSYQTSLKLRSSVRIQNGHVSLKLSRFLRGERLNSTVEKFLQWAQKRLSKVSADLFLPEYRNGGFIWTHNKIYELQIFSEDRKNVSCELKHDLIKLCLPETKSIDVKNLVEKVIISDQIGYLEEVVDELNQLYFQAHYNSVRFKRTKSRFGSCSSKGNINISFRLLFAPREVFRYVCVHELAHLKEMNHSRKFWALVGEAMPDYKEQEKWLKNNGFTLA